jgi:hypothetical protein
MASVTVLLATAPLGCGGRSESPTTPAQPALTVRAIMPKVGGVSGGTLVTITGTGLGDGATVTIGGIPATDVTVVSSIWLTATTPAHPEGTADVVVAIAEGRPATLTAGRFSYVPEDPCPGCPWDY